MTMKSVCQFVLSLAALQYFGIALADDVTQQPVTDEFIKHPFTIETSEGTVTAIKPDIGPIEQQSINFTFNWNDQATFADNTKKISELEKFIASIDDLPKHPEREQQALGSLLSNLGSYYTHIARDPDSAIAKLTLAASLLNTKEEKAWNDNQLAYAYAQKYAISKQPVYKEKSLFYANKVLSILYPNQQNKIVAFAYGIKGLLDSDDKNYAEAEKYFTQSLHIYEQLPHGKDDQYARIKNRLANTIIDQNGRDVEGLTLLQDVKKYWATRGTVKQNPYAARNMVALGHAYLKTGNAKAARDELKASIAIYKNIYGANSMLLVKPYQLLAQAYRKLGSLEQASALVKKANEIINA